MKEMTAAEALHRAAAYCPKAEHCISEVSEKLRQWGIGPDDAETIIARLLQEKFIDEARFARSFVGDKFRYSRWGRIKIAYALRAKRVPEALVYDALDERIDEEEYIESLVDLLESKRRQTRAADSYELKGKLFRFAAGRGYESDAISEALKRIG